MSLPAHVTRGSGDTAVVLLHGVGGGAAAWLPQLDALASCGHPANLERPRAFNDAVLAWLGRHFAG